jgi:hypothetical protein
MELEWTLPIGVKEFLKNIKFELPYPYTRVMKYSFIQWILTFVGKKKKSKKYKERKSK